MWSVRSTQQVSLRFCFTSEMLTNGVPWKDLCGIERGCPDWLADSHRIEGWRGTQLSTVQLPYIGFIRFLCTTLVLFTYTSLQLNSYCCSEQRCARRVRAEGSWMKRGVDLLKSWSVTLSPAPIPIKASPTSDAAAAAVLPTTLLYWWPCE